MSFLKNVTAFLPIGKKEEKLEYFFATNIGLEKITAALWTIEGKSLKVLDIASEDYASIEDIATVIDKLLDQVLGLKEIEPQKILFGVPDSWLLDDNLKEEQLKILRHLVKELELTPMAYVSISHALVHFLEKQEGIPVTAILVGFEKVHLTVTVVRAGKIDGVKVIKRGESTGQDIEKALLTFTDVETLPSKILIYGTYALELKSQLVSFSWMSKLSFLHFPKIENLDEELEIKSICLAGGSELNNEVMYLDHPVKKQTKTVNILKEEGKSKDIEEPKHRHVESAHEEVMSSSDESTGSDFGFVVGDIEKQVNINTKEAPEEELEQKEGVSVSEEVAETNLTQPQERAWEVSSFEKEAATPPIVKSHDGKPGFKFPMPKFNFTAVLILIFILAVIGMGGGAYVFLPKAEIKVFVEPKILEKSAEVIADPNQKAINEETKIIPGQVVDVEISGTAKEAATGKKQIGDPAKGIIVIRNKTDGSISLSKGTTFVGNNQKFSLDTSVVIASRSADDGTWGKATGTATALNIGADGNISSGTDLTAANQSSDRIVAKSEGNFSGGTSKDVTVVSSEDQQKLLAKLSSDLRSQAQQKLQEKYPNKKILEEALSEGTAKKNYNKNINDQATEFSLNMSVKYKGTAFDDADLKTIVSKLVTTQVPDGFSLDLSQTETLADVSKLEKDGRLVFAAKFKAKLMPKIDTENIRSRIKFKTPDDAIEILKNTDNILGSEINIFPKLPKALERLPLMGKNIKIEVGLK